LLLWGDFTVSATRLLNEAIQCNILKMQRWRIVQRVFVLSVAFLCHRVKIGLAYHWCVRIYYCYPTLVCFIGDRAKSHTYRCTDKCVYSLESELSPSDGPLHSFVWLFCPLSRISTASAVHPICSMAVYRIESFDSIIYALTMVLAYMAEYNFSIFHIHSASSIT
jgi:hypothetical protein